MNLSSWEVRMKMVGERKGIPWSQVEFPSVFWEWSLLLKALPCMLGVAETIGVGVDLGIVLRV